MNTPHPASQIFLGLSFIVFGSTRSGGLVILLALAAGLLAMVIAPRQMLAILRKSRWLLLTMFILFAWMTPGTLIPSLPGLTHEGLLLAAESVSRLLLSIATVAVLLRCLTPPRLVCGMRSLLAPLATFGDFRDRLAVRLMLTLDTVNSDPLRDDDVRQLRSLRLPVAPFGIADFVLVATGLGFPILAAMA